MSDDEETLNATAVAVASVVVSTVEEQRTNLLTCQKSTFSGRLVAPIHVKFGRAEGHVVPLRRAQFHANRCTCVGAQPKNGKKIHFLGKESPRRGEPFDRFLQLLGILYAELPCISFFYT